MVLVVVVVDPVVPSGKEKELVEFRTPGFFICLSVVPKGDPQCHDEDTDDEDS